MSVWRAVGCVVCGVCFAWGCLVWFGWLGVCLIVCLFVWGLVLVWVLLMGVCLLDSVCVFVGWCCFVGWLCLLC